MKRTPKVVKRKIPKSSKTTARTQQQGHNPNWRKQGYLLGELRRGR